MLHHWKSWLALVLISALWCGWSGCVWELLPQPPPPAPQPQADWKTLSGQLRYTRDGKDIIGDVVIRWKHLPDQTWKDASVTEFSKNGAILLKIARTENLTWITGPLARPKFSGYISQAPASLRGWITAPVQQIDRHSSEKSPIFRLRDLPRKNSTLEESFDFQLNP